MLKQSCAICKTVGAFAILGALNLGLASLFNVNLIEQWFGQASVVTRLLYGLVGLSGVMLLVSFFTVCPKCKRA